MIGSHCKLVLEILLRFLCTVYSVAKEENLQVKKDSVEKFRVETLFSPVRISHVHVNNTRLSDRHKTR